MDFMVALDETVAILGTLFHGRQVTIAAASPEYDQKNRLFHLPRAVDSGACKRYRFPLQISQQRFAL